MHNFFKYITIGHLNGHTSNTISPGDRAFYCLLSVPLLLIWLLVLSVEDSSDHGAEPDKSSGLTSSSDIEESVYYHNLILKVSANLIHSLSPLLNLGHPKSVVLLCSYQNWHHASHCLSLYISLSSCSMTTEPMINLLSIAFQPYICSPRSRSIFYLEQWQRHSVTALNWRIASVKFVREKRLLTAVYIATLVNLG